MKTALEHLDDLYSCRHGQSQIVTRQEIEAIQLDAFRAGMEFAAKVKVPFPKLNHPLSVELFEEGLNYKTNAILTAAAQLTEVPR